MSQSSPRAISAKILGAATGLAAMGLAVLAWTSADRLLDKSVADAFGASTTETGQLAGAGDVIVAPASRIDDIHLTHLGTRPAVGTSARIGDRLTLAPDGGPSADYEAIAVTEITGAHAATAAGSAPARLVMVTYREIAPRESSSEKAARTVRMIVETDEPVATTSTSGPARTL